MPDSLPKNPPPTGPPGGGRLYSDSQAETPWQKVTKVNSFQKFLIAIVVLVILCQIHPFFAGGDGNIFPFENYPQSLEWYVTTLTHRIFIAGLCFIIYKLCSKWGKEWEYLALTLFFFEFKEIFEYVLFANQLSSFWDICAFGVFVIVILIINASRKKDEA